MQLLGSVLAVKIRVSLTPRQGGETVSYTFKDHDLYNVDLQKLEQGDLPTVDLVADLAVKKLFDTSVQVFYDQPKNTRLTFKLVNLKTFKVVESRNVDIMYSSDDEYQEILKSEYIESTRGWVDQLIHDLRLGITWDSEDWV